MSDDPQRPTGLPDPDADYFVSVVCGRKAKPGEEEDKTYMEFTYPSLPYGGMVTIQGFLQELVMPMLVKMGFANAKVIGSEAYTKEQIEAILEERPATPAKPTPKR